MFSVSASTKTDLSRFLQTPPNIFLAKILPLSIYRKYLSMLGFYYYSANSEQRKSLSKSLKYVFGDKLDKKSFQYTLLKTYFGIFEHYYEKMVNAHKSLPAMMNYLNTNISIYDKDWIDQISAGKQGGILVTGHFGSVEYIPLYLASNNYRPSMVLRFKTENLKEALVRKSSLVDLELIDADSPNVIFKALNAIKDGRILITLCDEIHHWRPCKRDKVELFGHVIPKDRTLDIIYARSKAPICFGIIQRKKTGYELLIKPLADGKEDVSLFKSAWSLLERFIYQHPEQWYQWPNFYSEFTRYCANV